MATAKKATAKTAPVEVPTAPAPLPADERPTAEHTPRVKLRDIATGKVATYDAYRAREIMTAAGAPTHTIAPADTADDD